MALRAVHGTFREAFGARWYTNVISATVHPRGTICSVCLQDREISSFVSVFAKCIILDWPADAVVKFWRLQKIIKTAGSVVFWSRRIQLAEVCCAWLPVLPSSVAAVKSVSDSHPSAPTDKLGVWFPLLFQFSNMFSKKNCVAGENA